MELKENHEETGISLLELLQVLAKRKMLIVKISAFAAAVSVGYSLTLPNIYSATAKILPPQKETGGGLSALLGQAGGAAALASGGLGGGTDLYVAIVKSRSVADGVIRHPEVAEAFKGKSLEAARKSVMASLKVQGGKDGVISITASNKDPKRAALLANAFVDELGRATVRLNLSKAGTERLFLEKRLAVVKQDLKGAEDDLKAFSQHNKLVQVDAQTKASIESVARLKGELSTKEVQLAVLSSKMTDESPDVKALQASIRRLRGEIGALTGSAGAGEGIPAIGDVPGVGLEYSRKLRAMKTQEAIFEQLSKQYEMVKLNEAKDSSSLQVLDEAVVPTEKSAPKRSVMVIVSTMMAFFFSVFLAFAQEYLERMTDEDRKVLQNIKKNILALK